MLNRNVSLAVCLTVMAGAILAQSSNQGTGYVFEFANSTGSTGQFQAFIYNTPSFSVPVYNTSGPTGANQVLPKPDGSKFYVVGSGGVDDFNPSFTTPATINGMSGSPTQAILSPDGRLLLVASSLGSGTSAVYVLNTTNDTIGLNQPVNGSIIGMVASRDSTTAWILAVESGQATIVTLNLTSQQIVGSPVFLRDPVTGDSLAGDAQALSLSPLGLLYVSAGNQILEINPSTIQTLGFVPVEIGVNATVGPLRFSTDGTMAYFVNLTPSTGGRSLGSLSIPGHALNYSAYFAGITPELFDDIVIASSPAGSFSSWRLFAHSPGDTTLWDVSPDFTTPLASCSEAICPSSLNSVLPATNVLSIAISNELPSAQYLFALVGIGTEANLYRVSLTASASTSEASAAGSGTLQFAIVPPESSPTSFIQFNALQPNLAAGTTALPLIARVLDPTGRPMFAVPVTFTGDSSLIFTGVSATSNKDGYVQATVALPASEPPGSYPVTLTAGSGTNTATATFSLTIPGAVGTGPTGGGGPNQMTIVSGNGELFRAGFVDISAPVCTVGGSFFSCTALTVQLLDTNGHPLVNQDVTFTVTGANAAIAYLDNPNAMTDANGIASTDFYPQTIAQNTGFQGVTVTAVATQGAVTFAETVWQPDATGSPISATILQPSGSELFTAGEGDVIPNAIVGSVSLYAFGSSNQIPNVAINITNPDNSGRPGPASCQGSPVTDATGTVTCNLIAVCASTINPATSLPWGLGLQGMVIDFGNSIDKQGYQVKIVPGSTQTLLLSGGNNQSGRPGGALTLPLTATVADNCGTASQGITVNWKVTQGSATLAAASTVSNQGGTVANHVTLGQTPGTVTIVASINGTTLVTYTETIQTVVGNLTVVSGNSQVVLLNQPFAPIIFQLTDTNNNPVSGILVNFSVGSGSATLNSLSQTTNAQGQVTIGVTAGNVAGPVTILATYSTFTASASLTVTAPGPAITMSSFVNAASGQVGLTPCGLALVTGTGLAPGVNGVVVGGSPLGIGPLPLSLAGVSITINGTPAPLQAVSNQNAIQQVNFQTPCETVAGSPATVIVQVGSVTTQVTGVTVYPAQPGVFTYAGTGGNNYGYIIDSSGNALSPTNPAQPGQTYYMFATGLGQTAPAIGTNSDGTGLQSIPVGNVILSINNIGVPVTSVQYREGAIGEYLITFTIPVPFAAGTNLPIALGVTVNAQTFFESSAIGVALPAVN
jgi:uncharacterized protein (TIGR03437 family)